MTKEVNAIQDACPLPVVKAKKALAELNTDDTLTILVGNQIAVSNLERFASSQNAKFQSEALKDNTFRVVLTKGVPTVQTDFVPSCAIPAPEGKTVVVISSNKMGDGSDELGKILIKGFLFALTQLDKLPDTVLFYNSGAFLTTDGSTSIEDIKKLNESGVEILTCGTCLNHFGLENKLLVGNVSNMYTIVETMANAQKIIRP